MSADLRRRVRRCGFVLHELRLIDGARYLICDSRGLSLKGTDEEPLTAEQVVGFCAAFEGIPLEDPVLEQERELDEWSEREREAWGP